MENVTFPIFIFSARQSGTGSRKMQHQKANLRDFVYQSSSYTFQNLIFERAYLFENPLSRI